MNVLSEKISEKEDLLFQTTLKLVFENGFHGTSMSMISKESGVAIGTIYHYFKSKDELLLKLIRHIKQLGFEESFGKDNRKLDYQERFKLLWRHLYEHLVAHPEFMSYITQFYSSPFREKESNDSICFQTELGLFIQEGQRQNLMKDISHDLVSSIFLGSVMNCAKQYVHKKKKLKQSEMETLANIIWNGIKS